MVPGGLIRGEVGERVKEGGRATSLFQVLEYNQHIPSSNIKLGVGRTHSEPFMNRSACGMQNVAEIIPPLRFKEGFAARGSISSRESRLCGAPDKLMRRKMSWLDSAASPIAPVLSCRANSSAKKDADGGLVLLSGVESYAPGLIPGVTDGSDATA